MNISSDLGGVGGRMVPSLLGSFNKVDFKRGIPTKGAFHFLSFFSIEMNKRAREGKRIGCGQCGMCC